VTRPQPSVLLVADQAMTRSEAIASLEGAAVVQHASPARDAGPVDVIVVEQTMAPASQERLARLAAGAPGAPIVTVIAEGRGRYSWLRVRPTGLLYRIEAIGEGSLADAVLEASAPGRA
jgi:hypothetical protein